MGYIRNTYVCEGMGYLIATMGLGIIVYGIMEKSTPLIGVGIGNLLGGSICSTITKSIRVQIKGDLEKKLEDY